MIQLENVKKRYGEMVAVDGLNLKIGEGQIVGLLGPNGAGKTTTLRMMAGVLPTSEGNITFNGKDYDEYEHEIKQMIGYLPENNPLYEDMTVEEHLTFFAKLKGIVGVEMREAKAYAAERTGITSVYYRLIRELSKGYRQRAGLAQAILHKPRVLLLDEPTEGLDPNQRRDIQTLLSELRTKRTVVVSSHVLGEISKLASRIVIINKGMVVGDDSPAKLVQRFSGGQRLLVELVGKSGILQALRVVKGVKKVVKVGDQEYSIEVEKDADVRSAIFELAVKQKWQLLEIKQEEKQLEDVFAELTQA